MLIRFWPAFLIAIHLLCAADEPSIVIDTKRISLPQFPDAYNPSLIRYGQGYLLSFRFTPDRYGQHWVSFIGVVPLDESFNPLCEPQLLETRSDANNTPSQAEDARLFTHAGRVYLIYNDNIDVTAPSLSDRRDLFVAELIYEAERFVLLPAVKLLCEEKWASRRWQKNWSPFEAKEELLIGYSINPHEILYPNLNNGECYSCYKSSAAFNWPWGEQRGGTPPQLVDGEYLGFFHSGIYTSTAASFGWELWHYFAGAYTFSATPPYQLTKISKEPIIGKGFYTISNREKRVIFPGSFIASESKIYLVYGKDDYEIWIATLDKEALKKSLVSVEETKEAI
jgi:predicted GH43/DUF377 family glycosyl hydrolase